LLSSIVLINLGLSFVYVKQKKIFYYQPPANITATRLHDGETARRRDCTTERLHDGETA